MMHAMSIAAALVTATVLLSSSALMAQEAKPHAVFVIGTPHYEPGLTMPPLAKELERFGFRTTVVEPDWDPERNAKGIPGLEVLQQADVAVFFLRFLTLPKEQLQHILDYVQAGKPVVGLRTSTHAFIYPDGHELEKWNNGFGKDVLGSQYFLHMAGSTEVEIPPEGADHPILTGFPKETQTAAGTLYRAELPEDAVPLLKGTGKPKQAGSRKNRFGSFVLKETETSPVAWAWTNQWGGRVFTTTIGHVGSFANGHFVRLMINGIHWAAGKDVPPASMPVNRIVVEKKEPKQ